MADQGGSVNSDSEVLLPLMKMCHMTRSKAKSKLPRANKERVNSFLYVDGTNM